jgi:hypothetical protein
MDRWRKQQGSRHKGGVEPETTSRQLRRRGARPAHLPQQRLGRRPVRPGRRCAALGVGAAPLRIGRALQQRAALGGVEPVFGGVLWLRLPLGLRLRPRLGREHGCSRWLRLGLRLGLGHRLPLRGWQWLVLLLPRGCCVLLHGYQQLRLLGAKAVQGCGLLLPERCLLLLRGRRLLRGRFLLL